MTVVSCSKYIAGKLSLYIFVSEELCYTVKKQQHLFCASKSPVLSQDHQLFHVILFTYLILCMMNSACVYSIIFVDSSLPFVNVFHWLVLCQQILSYISLPEMEITGMCYHDDWFMVHYFMEWFAALYPESNSIFSDVLLHHWVVCSWCVEGS
jgi:hypothetical protein